MKYFQPSLRGAAEAIHSMVWIAASLSLLAMTSTVFAQEKTEEKTVPATAEANAPIVEKTGSAAAPVENPARFAPDFCDFEITFPEKPQIMRKCLTDDSCFEVYSYTMVYDLQTTVDVTANCTPSTPENYKRYTEGVMKAAVAGMVEDRNLTSHDVKFVEEGTVRSAAITGVGTTGAQDKIYTGQIWIGQNSVFTVQAELVGGAHTVADKSFSDILSSIKTKPGKQLPPKPKAVNVPKVNTN